MAESKIPNRGVKQYILTATPNQYGAIVFPNDLETLWNQGRVVGIVYCDQTTVLVNVAYSGGVHYFSCWNTRTDSAFTSQISLGLTYI